MSINSPESYRKWLSRNNIEALLADARDEIEQQLQIVWAFVGSVVVVLFFIVVSVIYYRCFCFVLWSL